MFADNPALVVEALDPDVVGVARPVHRGTRVGLRDDHQRQRRVRQCTGARRQAREAGRFRRGIAFAQHAQAAARDKAKGVLAVLAHQVVLAIAQERHVVVGQPFEEGAALGDQGRRQRRRRARVGGGGLLQARAHRLPVLHRGAHVGEHPFDPRHQLGALLGVDEPVDLDVHPRFPRGLRRLVARPQRDKGAVGTALHGEDGVRDQVQRQALPVDLRRRRVDQEGHVVVDDLDHRMARRPAVLGHGGAQDAHLGLAGGARSAELPLGQHGAAQVFRRSLGQIVGVEMADVLAREDLYLQSLFGVQARGGEGQHRFDRLAPQRIRGAAHGSFPPRVSPARIGGIGDEAYAHPRHSGAGRMGIRGGVGTIRCLSVTAASEPGRCPPSRTAGPAGRRRAPPGRGRSG